MYSCDMRVCKQEKLEDGTEAKLALQEDNAEKLMEAAASKVAVCAYCKYNVEHVFKTVKERDTHEQNCANRAQYEANIEKTTRIFNKNRNWIDQARQNKKLKNQSCMDRGDFVNVPQATMMPQLTYKYMMNEPFVAGTQATIQSSHD